MRPYSSWLPTASIFKSTSIHQQIARFHATQRWRAETFYQTLGLEPGASAGTIKKQFYSLSKTHHPDHNPNDPQASERFVKISEAYATLGNSEKRLRYDRDILRTKSNPVHQAPRGSHSSASTPYGARPASGLSRRRTQFKGPPPSFYRNGGWGAHTAHRKSEADKASRAEESSYAPGGGFGPGQGQAGMNNDVPHFDQDGHYRTQVSQEQRWKRRRRTEDDYSAYQADVVVRFLIVGAIVSLACIPFWSLGTHDGSSKSRDKASDV